MRMVKINLVFCFSLFLILFLFSFPIHSFCQEKVVEKSSKTPNWINSAQKDFIIESGKGASIDAARDQALSNVKESIVKSIAEKITSTSENKTTQDRQGNNYNISSNFQSVIRSKTADLPFLKGVSLNKVSDFYWEKLKDKKSGAIVYSYYLRYPFSDFELQSIILDYEMDQKKITDGLNNATEGIDEIIYVEQLLERMQTIRGIIPQLEEGDKATAAMTIVKLEAILKSIAVEEVANQKGTIKYFLTNGSRHFKTVLRPKIQSNCATDFRIYPSGDTLVLSYQSSDCFEVVSNSISVEYSFGNYLIKNTFPLIFPQKDEEFRLSRDIQLRISDMDTLMIKKYQIVLTVISNSQNEVQVKNVTIERPGHPIIPFNSLSNVIIKNGLNEIVLNGQISFKRKTFDSSDGSSILISGTVSYFNPKSGKTDMYKFFNEHLSISW